MTDTWEDRADAALSQGEEIIEANDARARRGESGPGEGDYATEPGCGTKAAILALLPLAGLLATWVGRMA